MEYNLLKPWLTLDDWQKKYIETEGNCFLLCGRQCGKTTAMSIKFGERALNNPNRVILMLAYTEKQAYNLFFKTLMYIKEVCPTAICKGKDKPTKHIIKLKNGSQIMCYAVGLDGTGIRTFTITDLVIDEAAPMSREVFVAVTPMLSVTGGSLDISSTPRGKQGYFFECSDQCEKVRDNFTRFYVSAEDCPRHSKEFLEEQKKSLTKLEYAQEYLAQFLDDVRQYFPDELIKKCSTLKPDEPYNQHIGELYLGVDFARMGKDDSAFVALQRINRERMRMIDKRVTSRTYLTESIRLIKELDLKYTFRRIYLDTGGMGAGPFDVLLEDEQTRRKVVSIDNATKSLNRDETKKKRLLKDDLYENLLLLMEQGKIEIFNDPEISLSLKSVQFDQDTQKIFGSNTHITEALIRAAWGTKDRTHDLWLR